MEKLKSSLRKLPPIEKFVIKRDIKKRSMIAKDSDEKKLGDYVKEVMEKGFDERRVRVALMSVGWGQEQVDRAFKKK